MKWLLIDNITPNRPVLINLANVDCINWSSGTLCFEFAGDKVVEVEAEKIKFIDIAQKLDIVEEVE